MLLNYRKFLAAKTFMNFYLWWAIATLYLIFRITDVSQAVFLISFYSILIVILEYPTWVIGDYFWHKKSVVLWSLLYWIGMLVMTIPMPRWWYLFPLTINALWSALESWSDVWLLKSIVPNFKNIYPWYKSYISLVQFVAAIVTWYIFKVSPTLPVLITWIACLIATCIFITINVPPILQNRKLWFNNIYELGIEWLRSVFSAPILIVLLWSYAVSKWYVSSSKTIINTMWELLNIDILWLTYAVWWMYIARSVWSYLSKKLTNSSFSYIPSIIAILTILLWVLTFTLSSWDWWLILIYFLVCALLIEAINSLITIYVASTVQWKSVASILSFYNLSARLFTAVYLFA